MIPGWRVPTQHQQDYNAYNDVNQEKPNISSMAELREILADVEARFYLGETRLTLQD